MISVVHDMALMRLRVELYGAAQILEGDALEELRTLIKEIVLVLELDRASADGWTSLRVEKDRAYGERNQCVAAMAKMAVALGWRAGLAHHDATDTSWDADWRNVVFIDLPSGQASWHLHDSEMHLFEGLPSYPERWDGHSVSTKYERLASATIEPNNHREVSAT